MGQKEEEEEEEEEGGAAGVFLCVGGFEVEA